MARAATPYLDTVERISSYFSMNSQCTVVEFTRMVARVKRSAGCEGRCSSATGGLTSHAW